MSALNPMKIIDSGMTTFSIPVGGDIAVVAVFGSISLFYIKDILVSCKEGYFGPDCGTPCTPRDNSTGHFTCNVNGAIVCLPGYQNTTTNCVDEMAKPLTTQSNTEVTPSTESTTTGQGDREAVVVPMAVGGAVGGSALLLLIVGFVIVVVLVWRSKRQRNVQPQGNALGIYVVYVIMLSYPSTQCSKLCHLTTLNWKALARVVKLTMIRLRLLNTPGSTETTVSLYPRYRYACLCYATYLIPHLLQLMLTGYCTSRYNYPYSVAHFKQYRIAPCFRTC